jgi:hypothetical protein
VENRLLTPLISTAWGANLPQSFDLLPYGKQVPVDPGNFFQPLSVLILVGSLGALISGGGAQPRCGESRIGCSVVGAESIANGQLHLSF